MKINHLIKSMRKLNKRNIAIIGHMGSGKSIFGQIIAKHFNANHVDTDREITKYEKASINEIFLTKGNSYFREIESRIVLKILNKKNIIISLGGGAILRKEIRDKLRKFSYTIFLDVDFNVLKNRLEKSKNRPLLKDDNILTKIVELDKKRRKHYLKADIILDNSESIYKTLENFKRIFSSIND